MVEEMSTNDRKCRLLLMTGAGRFLYSFMSAAGVDEHYLSINVGFNRVW